ncbi:MAG: bifunctional metallophosphatase/5'-nucleotidase [Rhodospirillales bacterium]|nr:bifunctional metallophosphatase/5'-nucleotidase [Rhodospirillales bacterium]
MIRRLALVLLVLLAAPSARSEESRITLLHFNDFYRLAPEKGQGGFAPLMTLIRAERARAPEALTILSGDFISPSLLSSFDQGQHMIALGNELGVDLAVPGNHEFDYGPTVFRARMRESRFPWLIANLFESDGRAFNNAPIALVREVGGVKVGFLGLITPRTAELAPGLRGFRFEPPIEAARVALEALKGQGAELFVALTHLTISEDRALARALPTLDLILGGHDHEPITWREGRTLIHKSGSDGHWLGVVELRVDREKAGERWRVTPAWRMEPTQNVTPDPAMAARVAVHEGRLEPILNQPVGACACVLDSRRDTVRTKDSSLAALVTDALRDRLGADAALMNGGGFRGDALRASGTGLTRRDLVTELPFGNVAVLLEISGRQLRQALEHGLARLEAKSGAFPQVSGLAVTYDPARPAGARILSIEIGGRTLDAETRYRLATSDYLAAGGDGYDMLGAGRLLVDASDGRLITSLVEDYLKAKAPVVLDPEPRMRSR